MSKLVVALIIVAAVLVGGLVRLWSNARQPMGSPEALARAKQRNLELEAEEQRERDE